MFSYALKSLTRQTDRYWRVICILICGMVIPLMLNILSSSNLYGNEQQVKDLRHDAEFCVLSAPLSLADAFEKSEYFTVTYVDDVKGNIFLHSILPCNTHEQAVNISKRIDEILASDGQSTLTVSLLTGLQAGDPAIMKFSSQLDFVSALVILISVKRAN